MSAKRVTGTAFRSLAVVVGMVTLVALAYPGSGMAFSFSKAGDQEESAASKLTKLKIKPGPKMTVAIYEFRSGVPDVSSRAATDMFVTALVNSGAFAVVERERLEAGVVREKELQSSEEATGNAGTSKLTGADYICEGVISEYSGSEEQGEVGLSMGGMETSRSKEAKSIGLDVRIINASTGKIIDSVPVRKEIKASGSSTSGIGNMLRMLTDSNVDADLTYKKAQSEGIDRALRECIDEAVYQLVKRYMAE
ncbi:CsgG/HfaB family protein [Geomonas sp. RF6]|uniref:CsgG/HfaB family protein n=1 Tax=Geomonas sp. RF6 TaxID=2897342 RepID=UPI001E2AAB5C|nr:CsgG/HfaB family protein [Geomonas sp. RF6]UFS68878.1 CsgG/HfaB family protein [Geomonas sp. RF6]